MRFKAHSIFCFCFLCFLSSCRQEEKGKPQDFVIRTAKPTTIAGEHKKEFSFISQPFRTSELSFRVGGPIDRFDVYAGNHYKQGSIIAEISSRDFHVHYERAEGIYLQAKAEYERIQSLFEKNNLSASVYEKAKAEYTTAKTAFDTAANELEDTRLLAPFNGYVGEVYMEKFQDVKATQPVLSLIDIDQLKIEIYVTQDIAYAIGTPDSVDLFFDAQPHKRYRARVAEISKGTTRNNLSFLLTAILPNQEEKLPAGLSGKAIVHIPTTTQTDVVTIPQRALCHRPSIGNYVWVVNGNQQTELRKVTTGRLVSGGYIEVKGIKADETIAVSGLRFLSDGMQVSTSEKGQE